MTENQTKYSRFFSIFFFAPETFDLKASSFNTIVCKIVCLPSFLEGQPIHRKCHAVSAMLKIRKEKNRALVLSFTSMEDV